jgi:hypothetical protein
MTTKVSGVPAVQVMVLLPLLAQSAAAAPARPNRTIATMGAFVLDLPTPRASSEATAQIPCDGLQTTRKTRFMRFFLMKLNT